MDQRASARCRYLLLVIMASCNPGRVFGPRALYSPCVFAFFLDLLRGLGVSELPAMSVALSSECCLLVLCRRYPRNPPSFSTLRQMLKNAAAVRWTSCLQFPSRACQKSVPSSLRLAIFRRQCHRHGDEESLRACGVVLLLAFILILEYCFCHCCYRRCSCCRSWPGWVMSMFINTIAVTLMITPFVIGPASALRMLPLGWRGRAGERSAVL